MRLAIGAALVFVAFIMWSWAGCEAAEYWCTKLGGYDPSDAHYFVGAVLGPVTWFVPFIFGDF